MVKKGEKVQQVMPAPIVGEVAGYAVCQETGDVQIKVVYPAEDGSQHERHFKESELQSAE